MIQLDRFFDVGIDFRGKNLLPGFVGNSVNTLFPDPTFNSVILSPDLNKDLHPSNAILDVVE